MCQKIIRLSPKTRRLYACYTGRMATLAASGLKVAICVTWHHRSETIPASGRLAIQHGIMMHLLMMQMLSCEPLSRSNPTLKS